MYIHNIGQYQKSNWTKDLLILLMFKIKHFKKVWWAGVWQKQRMASLMFKERKKEQFSLSKVGATIDRMKLERKKTMKQVEKRVFY